jgi:hypothetical protein
LDFLEALYGEGEGFCEIVSDNFVEERFFSWPTDKKTIAKYVSLREEEDVYCSTTLFNEKRRLTEFATEGKVVYADADTCDPRNFRLQPSISVQTSPGKWHTYWMLDQMHTAAEVSVASRKIAAAHKAQGCDAGWIPTKLLRIPGTLNTKYTVPYRVEATYSGDLYSLAEIEQAYKDITLEKVKASDDSMSEHLPSVMDATAKIPADLWDLYAEEPPAGADWSSRLFRLELELFRAGLNREEVFVVARASKCNKYARDDRDETLLWKEVTRAQEVYGNDDAITPDMAPEPIADETKQFFFLTDDERKWTDEHPTFIERFSDWVGTRSPQSAVEYRRSMAYMLLSCIFGEKGFVEAKYGKMNLNLWTFMLGETTATKKTTVMNMMKDVLTVWEEVTAEVVDLGEDFTAEALNLALAERDAQVTLMTRDEVDGFFQELLMKNYLAGTAETLTALYDGKVRRTLRATKAKSQTEKVSTIFNFIGLGTLKATCEVLTVKRFHSGFLMRPLWAIADAPPWTAEAEYFQLSDDKEKGFHARDKMPQTFVDEFLTVASALKNLPVRMSMSQPALARLHAWQRESHDAIAHTRNFEYIDPSRQRLTISLVKAAALLAISSGRTLISAEDMIQVIKQSELWFRDMVRIINSVASSDFEGHVNNVERFIAQGEDSRVPKTKVYDRFRQFPTGQVDEFIRALKEQGRVKPLNLDGKQMLAINN